MTRAEKEPMKSNDGVNTFRGMKCACGMHMIDNDADAFPWNHSYEVCRDGTIRRSTEATLQDIPSQLRALANGAWGQCDEGKEAQLAFDAAHAIESYQGNVALLEAEIERLRAFRNRVVGFFNELHEESKDEDGCRVPYMLYGDAADVLERFEKVIGEDRNG